MESEVEKWFKVNINNKERSNKEIMTFTDIYLFLMFEMRKAATNQRRVVKMTK